MTDPVSEVWPLIDAYAQALIDEVRNDEGYDVGKDTDQCENCIRVERAALEAKVRELEKDAASVNWCRSRFELLRGALADLAYSKDMTLDVAREKASRIYIMTTPDETAQPVPPAKPGECHNGCRFKTDCPNMKEREGDLSMTHEHYDCAVCGAHVALDYDDMR